MTPKRRYLHPVCEQMKKLRTASGLSIAAAADLCDTPAIVLGSYERGDRRPPLEKLEHILNRYGYTVAAVPMNFNAVRLPGDMASTLRSIADQLDPTETEKKEEPTRNAVPIMPPLPSHIS